MGQITTTQNLVAIKEVRHAGQQKGEQRHVIGCWYIFLHPISNVSYEPNARITFKPCKIMCRYFIYLCFYLFIDLLKYSFTG